MNATIIAPSVLSANFANLGKDIQLINESEAAWIHIDVMDGVFVPNISYGFPILQAIRKLTSKFLDVHLMIDKPERFINSFKIAGADLLTIHYEGNFHLHSTIQQIKSEGMKVGVALNPGTPVSVLSEVIEMLDLVLIMSVNPGFGGQKFIPESIRKVEQAADMILKSGSKAIIEVDGGVGVENAAEILAHGASVLVAGSSVFGSDDPKATISLLKNANNK